MLMISRAQRGRVGEGAFVDRVVTHFERHHLRSVCLYLGGVLRRRVVHGLEKGRSYGLTWEYSLTVFVAHMLTINPEFDKQPAIQRALLDPSREPDRRIDALVREVSREAWEEAAGWCDAEAYWQRIGAPTPPRAEP